MISIGVTNKEGYNIIQDDLNKLVPKYCRKHSDPKGTKNRVVIEEALVWSIIGAETNNKPFCIRPEEQLKKAKWYLDVLSPAEIKDPYSFCSIGIMQILYGIAKNLGYRGRPLGLLDTRTGLEYGILHLKNCIKRYNSLEDVISSYNIGTLKEYKTGKYLLRCFIDSNKNGIKEWWELFYNYLYVHKVLKLYKQHNGYWDVSDMTERYQKYIDKLNQ